MKLPRIIPSRRFFALINDAYVKARYSSHYRITIDELEWLRNRVDHLLKVVENASLERLTTLEAAE